ncbi:hypothetical protein AtNW77_Chr2g0258801 [Arabidopsis thaliana]|jgi:hypothetical protein|uniref:Transmembrane protein n=5 Tax=Arabidopsis TaxID=3701 RepID=A0A654EZP9_ARATH|nr:forkhead box protein G1 [Arabidopsis thaliana]KAG7638847.1 hypothetical protein ISN45_At02g032360 [Arabidopsis thaliana x Arabidopsis arenosa]KAG7643446.1 hypothetical protein ISN44_As02g032540 [Arabidopsis suecica]AEC09412.1 forkhead box protein G1 [Arabidopsis thaliana]CAA0375263.1 unnamed protein product [Arabidopsis thaliana]VYS54756.1 unnamed protein product [Arabidopsis thaliana]|eukprot:NP_181289.2 forkhead box protein G1 [Arabidopsis thaliana]
MIRHMFSSLTHRFAWRIPHFVYGATWTLFLTLTVAIISLAPEFAFVSAIFPSSSEVFSRRCGSYAAILVPLDLPSEVLCLPANLFRRSKMDLVVPPVFAAIVVALSAVVVRTMGLWEADEAH